MVWRDQAQESALTEAGLKQQGASAHRLRSSGTGTEQRATFSGGLRAITGERASSDISAAAVSSIDLCFLASKPPQGSEMPMQLGPWKNGGPRP